MRWLVDECVDAGLAEKLRDAGHDVVYAAALAPGAPDSAVIDRAQAEGRLLLTDDKDFGDLVIRRAWPVPGVVLLRIDPEKHALKWVRLQTVVAALGDGLQGRYTVIEPTRFRSRSLRPPRLV